MAEEDDVGGEGAGATVKLTADASPFEEVLDKAAASAKGWAEKVAGSIQSLNDFSATRLEEFRGKVEGLGALTSEEIGSTLGGTLGTALGAVGGPAGAKVGQLLGKAIGEAAASHLDFSAAAAAVAESVGGVQDAITAATDQWNAFAEDGEDTFARIKEGITSLTFGDFYRALVEDNADASAKISGVWDAVTAEISDFFDRGLDRVRQAIDGAWAAVKEPLAAAADWIEGAGVKVGLLEKGTESWGDSLRSVGDVGERVIRNLAGAFEYLRAVFQKVGGYAEEYLLLPLGLILSEMTEQIGKFLRGVNDVIVEQIGGPRFQFLDKAADALKKFKEDFDRNLPAAFDRARRNQAIDPEDAFDRGFDAVGNRLNRGREQNDALDLDRWMREMLEGLKELKEAPKAAAAGGGMTAGPALIANTREAVNAIVRYQAMVQGSPIPNGPAERAAAAAEEAALTQREIKNALETLVQLWDGAPLMKLI